MNGTPRAGPRAVTGEPDEQKSAESPRPRHHDRDPLGLGTLRHPLEKRGRMSANLARDARGSTVIERPHTSSSNRARRISEGILAAKAKWEADRCSEHFS